MGDESRHIFVGDLAETPLPEMLATIHRYRVPGMVEAQIGEFSKRVAAAGGRDLRALLFCKALKQEVYRSLDRSDGEDPFRRTVTSMDSTPRGPRSPPPPPR